MSNTFTFTVRLLKALKAKNGHRTVFQDFKENGLSLYVTPNNIKTFFVRKRIKGRDEKIIIGNFPDLTIEQARNKAMLIKSEIASGKNPNDSKRKSRDEYSLEELFLDYIDNHAKTNKVTWKMDLEIFKNHLSSLKKKRISDITKNDVIKTIHYISKNKGKYIANKVIVLLSSIYNKSIEWGWTGINPAKGVKKYKELTRNRFIQPQEFPAFIDALKSLNNPVFENYIYISLFTGARKSNVLEMSWDQIDFDRKIWTIPRTKNGEVQDVVLVDQAIALLLSIKQKATSNWVLPSPKSKTGHLVEPKSNWRRLLQISGLQNLRLHDIRRTLASYQAIQGTSLHIIGETLGHKSSKATRIYARLNDSSLRKSLSTATNTIIELGENKDRDAGS